MRFDLLFFLNSALLGVGLAMDAFSVSLANGLNEPDMRRGRMCFIAGIFGGFQALMPLLGWLCLHTLISVFEGIQKFIPWIALALLLYIGIQMLVEGLRAQPDDEKPAVSFGALMLQGIATSIDALSVGLTIASYNALQAVTAALIIALVTFIICMAGLFLGRKFGTKLAGKASILGGVILILIGLEIFIKGVFL